MPNEPDNTTPPFEELDSSADSFAKDLDQESKAIEQYVLRTLRDETRIPNWTADRADRVFAASVARLNANQSVQQPDSLSFSPLGVIGRHRIRTAIAIAALVVLTISVGLLMRHQGSTVVSEQGNGYALSDETDTPDGDNTQAVLASSQQSADDALELEFASLGEEIEAFGLSFAAEMTPTSFMAVASSDLSELIDDFEEDWGAF